MNSIPRFTRTIGDETESQFWWFVSGQLLDLSDGYTFSATMHRNDDPTKANVFGTAKTTGFTGQAGSGTKGNGTPNLIVTWATTGEMNLPEPGEHTLVIVATKTATGAEETLKAIYTMDDR